MAQQAASSGKGKGKAKELKAALALLLASNAGEADAVCPSSVLAPHVDVEGGSGVLPEDFANIPLGCFKLRQLFTFRPHEISVNRDQQTVHVYMYHVYVCG